MKTDRVSRIVTLLIVTGLVLAACGPTTTPTTAPPTAAPATGAPATAAPPPTEEPPTDGTPYKIGFCAAITGSGSSLGIPERNTAEMLAEQYADGIVGPDGLHHDVEFLIYDTESNPDTAASVASRLITEDDVDVLVCGTLSGNSMAIVPIATENEIVFISMASARSIIEDPETGETRKWIFKTPQENLHSGEWQAQYLEAMGIETVCDLYENTGYGQDCLAQTTVAVEAKGIEVVYSDTFERSDTEFPQMAGVQGSGCEAIVVGAIPPGASMVTVAAREVLPNLPVIQGHGVCNQTYIDLAGEAAEGVVFPCGRLMIADLLPDDDLQKPVLLKYIADYTAFTDGEPIDTFGGHAWDGIMWAIEGLESLKEGLSLAERRAGVRDYIEDNIKNWPGTGGVFTITADDHLGLEYDDLTFVKVENGTWVYFPPEQWAVPVAPPDLTGETITIYHFGDLSGPYAAITAPLIHGAEDAVAAINAAGGLYGAMLAIQFADTAGSIDEAVAAYDRFTGEDQDAVVMITYGSGEVEALAQRFAQDKIVNISAGLSARGFYIDSGYTFGLGPIYPDQLAFAMEFLKENWDTYKPADAGQEIKLAYLSWPTAFGQGALTDESRAYLEELGIEVVAEETYDLSPTADTTTAILNAQAAGANVIWTNTLAFGTSVILNDLNALGLRDQFIVGVDNWGMDLATYAFLADPAYGVGLIAPFPYLWWTDTDNPGVQYAQQLFEANERGAGEHNVGYLLLVAGVDMIVQAITDAIDTVGYENLDGEAVHDALVAMSPFEALDGVVRADFSGDNRSPHMSQIRMIQGGPDAFVVIQDWAEMPDLRPAE